MAWNELGPLIVSVGGVITALAAWLKVRHGEGNKRIEADVRSKELRIQSDLQDNTQIMELVHFQQAMLDKHQARLEAQLGRFLSRDPIGLDGGHNLYEYGASSPNNSVDPDGLNPITWWIWESTVPGPYGNPEPTKWGTVSDISSWNDLIDYVCQNGTGAERTIFMSSLVTGVSATTIAVMVGLGQASGRIPRMLVDGRQRGGRLFQIRPSVGRGLSKKASEGIFRLDFHKIPGSMKNVLHYHMKPDMSLHRMLGMKEAGAAASAAAVYVVATIKCKPESDC